MCFSLLRNESVKIGTASKMRAFFNPGILTDQRIATDFDSSSHSREATESSH